MSATDRLERHAPRARDARAGDLAKRDDQVPHAADVAERTEATLRRASPNLPLVLAGAAGLTFAGMAATGMGRLLGRVVTGAACGVAAGLAMNQVHALWSAVERRVSSGDEGDASASSAKPATVQAAEAVAGPLPEDREEKAGSLAHHAMAATTGAIYALARALPLVGIGRGLGYGAAVWLVADETLVPLLGLSKAPWAYPAKTHVRALLAHLVYGATLDAGVRLVMG